MRKIVKLAIGYAVTKALAHPGGPRAYVNSLLSSTARAAGRRKPAGRRGSR
jgi:hypothetical protein